MEESSKKDASTTRFLHLRKHYYYYLLLLLLLLLLLFIFSTNCVLTMICLVKIQTWFERKFQKNSRLNDIDMDDAIILEKYL